MCVISSSFYKNPYILSSLCGHCVFTYLVSFSLTIPPERLRARTWTKVDFCLDRFCYVKIFLLRTFFFSIWHDKVELLRCHYFLMSVILRFSSFYPALLPRTHPRGWIAHVRSRFCASANGRHVGLKSRSRDKKGNDRERLSPRP